MTDNANHPAPPAAAPPAARVPDLPPKPAAALDEPGEADAVRGGMGINRIVVTDGQIKG